VRFVVAKVAVGQAFPPSTPVLPFCITALMLHDDLHLDVCLPEGTRPAMYVSRKRQARPCNQVCSANAINISQLE